MIGVAKGDDGVLYWTVDGNWLLDDAGNKVKAEGRDGEAGQNGTNGSNGTNGTNGQDGVTPKFEIRDGKWYVSYDNGTSWTELGQATGDQGPQGETGATGPQGPQGETGATGSQGPAGSNGENGDSFFQSVDTTNADYVIFTLANGEEFKVLKYKPLSVTLNPAGELSVKPAATEYITYSITTHVTNPKISVMASNNWKATVVKADSKTGKIKVTAPSTDATDADLTIFVSDGDKTVMDMVTLSVMGISLNYESYTFEDQIYGTLALSANVNPISSLSQEVQWQSSNPGVASVTDDGVVTALSDGTAVITVTSVARPDLQTTCEVIVKTRYSEAEVGQYIYADGNFGNDHSKAVARIIWKGNPGLTDGTLRADHPQCVHGVAVAMTIYGNDKFYGYLNSPGSAQSIIEKYEDLSQYEIQGYNNTKCLLECYSKDAISNKNYPSF